MEVLTWLKEIIRDNLLFDERNPAMIVGDAPLEAALRKKKVHANNIQSVVIEQLTMVEARQGPRNPAMLIGGMTRLGRVPAGPRPEVRAAATPASTQGARVVSLVELPTGSVVLHSPASGITEVPARSVVMHNPLPGIQQEIGTVSYTAPARPATGQNAGGAAAAAMSTGAGFTGVRIRPLIRMPGAARGPPLSREAAASTSQVIVTLTLLLANAGPTDGFMAYSCEDMKSPMVGYELTPQAGCWMKQPAHENLKPRDGRIVWMRDGIQFPVVHCKMTETVMHADCGSKGELKPWRMIAIEKLVPISPRDCLDISDSGKATLFDQTVVLTRNGTAVKVLEERVNCDSGSQGPIRRSSGGSRKAYVQLTVRRILVWRRVATESITKKIIVKGAHDIIPNYIAGGMDAIEGTYVWNYTTRNCPEEEWEELYKGRLGILKDEVITLDRSAGQRAWLRLEKGVTICGKRMRSTHLLHVYVEWDGHQRAQDTTKKYTVPPEERELESMRLEWSYQRGRDGYMLHWKIQDAVTEGCWMQGTLVELRQSQAAGIGKPRGVASHFGVGHLVVRSGGVIYMARCGMVVVELRNHTTCTQEIPVTHREETCTWSH